MADSQNVSSSHKAQGPSISPSDRLDILIRMQQERTVEPWFPGMSVSPVNSPSAHLAHGGTQQPEGLFPASSRPMSLPLRPRIDSGRENLRCKYTYCQMSFDTEMNRQLHEQLHHYNPTCGDKDGADRQPIFAPGPMKPSDFSSPSEYSFQVMLLERQNRSRLALARSEQEAVHLRAKIGSEPFKTIQVHPSSGAPYEVSLETVIAYMRKAGATEDAIQAAHSNRALLDYNCQLMLLEQQNKNRLLMARSEAPLPYESGAGTSIIPHYQQQLEALHTNPGAAGVSRDHKAEGSSASQIDYEKQLKQLEAMNEKRQEILNSGRAACASKVAQNGTPRVEISRKADEGSVLTSPNHQAFQDYLETHPQNGPNHALQDLQMQLMLLEQQNKKRLMCARPKGTNVADQANKQHNPQPTPTRALQDHQMQLMLLEQQNKKRLMCARSQEQNGVEQANKQHNPPQHPGSQLTNPQSAFPANQFALHAQQVPPQQMTSQQFLKLNAQQQAMQDAMRRNQVLNQANAMTVDPTSDSDSEMQSFTYKRADGTATTTAVRDSSPGNPTYQQPTGCMTCSHDGKKCDGGRPSCTYTQHVRQTR
jgi:hypothetical protein